MFTKQILITMLNSAIAQIEAEHEHLSALDAATGDGDRFCRQLPHTATATAARALA